ncbi:MAG: sporulation protein YqfD [Lachnospiraceae bacterium]|nr:sporulation protein YqfD [Lachnospiraceae bacterium]
MIGLFRFIQGYLRIKVWGYSPERFMNLCCNHDILLWDIEKCENESYSMNISLRGYFQIRPFVRKTGTKVAVLGKFGLPFFIPHLKVHLFFLVGIVGTLIFLFWTTGYIWKIEIEGTQKISGEEMISFLEEEEIKIGSSKNNISVEELEKEIRNKFPLITWTSVQIEGTKLWIQIKENDKIMNVEAKTEVKSHLVASKDGKISSIITRNGVPMVKAGDEVKKGDILVAGQVPIYNDGGEIINYHLYEADADIYLECDYSFQTKMPVAYVKHQYTGEEYRSLYLQFCGKEIVFPDYRNKGNCDITEKRKQLQALEQWFLPVFYGVDYYKEYEPVTTEYTKEEVKRQLNKEINTFVSSLEEKGVQFIEKDVKIVKDNSQWVATASFHVIEKTGESVPIDSYEMSGENGQ